MKLDLVINEDVTVIRIGGEFNADSAVRFNNAVNESIAAGRRDFVVDLAQVTLVDSAGLELLTALQRRCEDELGMMCLSGLDEDLTKIMAMTRLDRLLNIQGTSEAAQASLLKV